jgi:hypothetical protein
MRERYSKNHPPGGLFFGLALSRQLPDLVPAFGRSFDRRYAKNEGTLRIDHAPFCYGGSWDRGQC